MPFGHMHLYQIRVASTHLGEVHNGRSLGIILRPLRFRSDPHPLGQRSGLSIPHRSPPRVHRSPQEPARFLDGVGTSRTRCDRASSPRDPQEPRASSRVYGSSPGEGLASICLPGRDGLEAEGPFWVRYLPILHDAWVVPDESSGNDAGVHSRNSEGPPALNLCSRNRSGLLPVVPRV